MRVLRVVVLHRNPFQLGSKILLHSFDQTTRQTRQVYPITELRRDNEFEHSLVSCALPALELPGNVDSVVLSIETHGLRVVFEGGALARQVTSMRLPLPSRLVIQIGHSDGAALMIRASAFSFPAWAAVAGLPTHASVVHEKPETARPCRSFVARNASLWRPEPGFPPPVSSCHGLPDPPWRRVNRPTSPDRQPS